MVEQVRDRLAVVDAPDCLREHRSHVDALELWAQLLQNGNSTRMGGSRECVMSMCERMGVMSE